MKKHTLILASLCLVAGLTVVPAYAQVGGVKAKVPFSFALSGKTFPAGEYRMIASSHQVNIEDDYGKVVAMVLANDVSGRSAGENGQIIFLCYRDRCFLSQVWSPTQENGRELLTYRQEAELTKEGKGNYFAVLGEKPRK
jgi:hypothetical protein